MKPEITASGWAFLLSFSGAALGETVAAEPVAQREEPAVASRAEPAPDPRAGTSASMEQGEVLTLDRVLRSARRYHPLIQAATARFRKAQGDELSASGIFDPRLLASGKVTTLGYYDLRQLDVEARQATPLWGAEFLAGYRLGIAAETGAAYPSYYSDATLEGGELRAGLELPVFRGGPTDAGRTRLRAAKEMVRGAEQGLLREELQTDLMAARAYYRWVLAGRRLAFSKELLGLAEERDVQLSVRFQAGAVTEFDVLDNRRMVIERRERLVQARREFEQAAIDLSLFYRGADGKGLLASQEALPVDLPESHHEHLDEGHTLDRCLSCHPEVLRVGAEIRAAQAELELSQNQLAPDVRLSGLVSRDLGDESRDPTLSGTVLEAGFKLSMPILLRPERGRLDAAQATLKQRQAELRWARDQLAAFVRDSASKLRAAEERRDLSRGLLRATSDLALGERQRFLSGEGNLMFVNLREQALMDAEVRLAEAEISSLTASYEWELLRRLGNCGAKAAPSKSP